MRKSDYQGRMPKWGNTYQYIQPQTPITICLMDTYYYTANCICQGSPSIIMFFISDNNAYL